MFFEGDFFFQSVNYRKTWRGGGMGILYIIMFFTKSISQLLSFLSLPPPFRSSSPFLRTPRKSSLRETPGLESEKKGTSVSGIYIVEMLFLTGNPKAALGKLISI